MLQSIAPFEALATLSDSLTYDGRACLSYQRADALCTRSLLFAGCQHCAHEPMHGEMLEETHGPALLMQGWKLEAAPVQVSGVPDLSSFGSRGEQDQVHVNVMP